MFEKSIVALIIDQSYRTTALVKSKAKAGVVP
jgi:hypothetical protein